MGNKAHITVSIGVSTFPDDAMDREGLIKAADDALYMSKEKGETQFLLSGSIKLNQQGQRRRVSVPKVRFTFTDLFGSSLRMIPDKRG